jgi:hypothetical protein
MKLSVKKGGKNLYAITICLLTVHTYESVGRILVLLGCLVSLMDA